MRFIVLGIIAGCWGGVVGFGGWRLVIGDGGRFVFLRNEATRLLQLSEGLEGAEEAAFGGGDGAGQEGKQTGIDRFADGIGCPGAGFHFAEAAETPEVLGEFIDEDFFGGRGGRMLAAERGAEFVEFGGVFTGADELLGVEAVLEGVLGGAGFAFGGAWAGGALGVAAIDFGAAFFESVEWRCVENHAVLGPDGDGSAGEWAARFGDRCKRLSLQRGEF